MSVVLETRVERKPKLSNITWRLLLKKAKEIEKEVGIPTFGSTVNSDWKYETRELKNDRFRSAKKIFTQKLRGRFCLYKYFSILDNYATDLITDERYPFLEEKTKFHDMFKYGGIEEAEKYAKQIIQKINPKLLEPKKLAGNMMLDYTKHEDNLYDLYNSIDEKGNYINFQRAVFAKGEQIEAELGDEFKKKLDWCGVMQFILYPKLRFRSDEKELKEYLNLYSYAISLSKTLQKIQNDIYKINAYTKAKLSKTSLLYRGGSIDEVFKLERHHGKTGYHKRGVSSMKGKNFTSTSVFPLVALNFTSHDFIPQYEGIVFEYDISEVPKSNIRIVRYDMRGACTQDKYRSEEFFWPTEKFGGYYTPFYVHQAEVHLKKGAVPTIKRVWVSPNLNKDKKNRVVEILTKLYPGVQIYEDEKID